MSKSFLDMLCGIDPDILGRYRVLMDGGEVVDGGEPPAPRKPSECRCVLDSVRPMVGISDDGRYLRATVDLSRRWECERCAGTLHHDEGRGTRCHAGEIEYRCSIFNQAKLPGLYHDADPLWASASMRERMDSFQPGHPGIWYTGAIGAGKTRTIVTAFWYLTLHRGIRCVYQDTTELLAKIRESYNEHVPETEASIIADYASVDVLLLDDVAKRTGDFEGRILDALIDARYRRSQRCTTYVLSNLSPEKIETGENYDWKRVISRLREMTVQRNLFGGDRRSA